MMLYLWPFLTAFTLSAVACALLVWLAPRMGFIDAPGTEAHKQQKRSVPYGGGIAVMFSVLAGFCSILLLEWTLLDWSLIYIILTALGLWLLGLLDDVWPMRARIKLVIQATLIALGVGFADLRLDVFVDWPWLSAFLAFWWCLVLANAYNLMDHADGVSGSVAVVSIVVLLATSLFNGDVGSSLLWIMMIGAISGFLVWNLPPAKIYMGDCGSLPIGFIIGAGSIYLTFWFSDGDETNPLSVLTPVLIATLPIYDMLVVIVKRHRLNRPIMQGDRNHISHRLGRLGLSPRKTLATTVALQVSMAGGALLLRHQDMFTGIVVVAQAAALLLIATLLEANRDRAI